MYFDFAAACLMQSKYSLILTKLMTTIITQLAYWLHSCFVPGIFLSPFNPLVPSQQPHEDTISPHFTDVKTDTGGLIFSQGHGEVIT